MSPELIELGQQALAAVSNLVASPTATRSLSASFSRQNFTRCCGRSCGSPLRQMLASEPC
jgi:hypothetical protein